MNLPVIQNTQQQRDSTTFFHFRLRNKRDGTIYPRCGATVRYGDDPNARNPVLHIAFCSPMDNYSKEKGRKLCTSCAEDGNPNTRIDLPTVDWDGKALAEPMLLHAIDKHWQNQLYEWHKAGTVLGPKKHHKPVNWMNYELVLTKKKRKPKALKTKPSPLNDKGNKFGKISVWMEEPKRKAKANGKKKA